MVLRWGAILALFGFIEIIPLAADEGPGTVVERFYQALREKNCAAAVRLRPGYEKKQCWDINVVGIPEITIEHIGDSFAVVQIKLRYQTNSTPHIFDGYLTVLKRESGTWFIADDSYSSHRFSPNLEAYLTNPKFLRIQSSTIGTPSFESMPSTELATAEPKEFSYAPTPRPGAHSLLEACWDPKALRGTLSDRKIYMNLNPVETPPLRTQPHSSLPPLAKSSTYAIRYIIPKTNEKLVALTFDLCETTTEVTGYDAELVNILRDQHAKATFFAGGKWLRTHPEKAMQLIADPLFEIGNHTWGHENLRVTNGKERLDQILWTQAQYELLRERLLALPCAVSAAPSAAEKIPLVPSTFRFPYGTCDREALDAVAEIGLYPIQFSVISGDPSPNQTAGRIVQTILHEIRPGFIITAHANGRGWHTAEALVTLIPELRARGYRFVTVSELLLMGQPVARNDCYEKKPGDTLHYDYSFSDN